MHLSSGFALWKSYLVFVWFRRKVRLSREGFLRTSAAFELRRLSELEEMGVGRSFALFVWPRPPRLT